MGYAFAENTSPNLRVGYVTITTSNNGSEKATVNGGHGNKGKYYTKEGRTYIYQVGTKDMCGCNKKYTQPGYTDRGFCDDYGDDWPNCGACP
jgi:hypothetical protein